VLIRLILIGVLLLLLAAPALGLEVGRAVLARWNIPQDLYYYPATVEKVRGLLVDVRYHDGSAAAVPAAAIMDRSLEVGDFVEGPAGPGRVIKVQGDEIKVEALGNEGAVGGESTVKRADLKCILRTDAGFAPAPAAPLEAGARVLAKRDARGWWVATVRRTVGQAVEVVYDDGSRRWLPRNLVAEFDLAPGAPVLGVNAADGQPAPARLRGLTGTQVKLEFFDGFTRNLDSGSLIQFRDQPGLDFGDPCPDQNEDGQDAIPHAETLRSWLSPRIHLYGYESGGTPLERIELGFALWLPRDRPPAEKWREMLTALARQVERFLERELQLELTLKIHPEPVRGSETLAWYRENLDEESDWHVWEPTRSAVARVFPDGPVPGRHRTVVVVPDAPGISADDSGVEKGMGFVRADGSWFSSMTLEGLLAINDDPGTTGHHQWEVDFLATTLAHETLHTIGLPHTDGDPWSVMNLGPWFPITRPEVHVAELHLLVLRSPFASLSLSQGFALYLLDPGRDYLDTIRAWKRGDPRWRLHYAHGADYFRLGEVLSSFGPDTRWRFGAREFTGERTICRAYLASFVAFLLETSGPKVLKSLAPATDADLADLIAVKAGKSLPSLEAAWHAWLAAQGE